MKVIVPSKKDVLKVLGNALKANHAAQCGTCACKCACRYNDNPKKPPW